MFNVSTRVHLAKAIGSTRGDSIAPHRVKRDNLSSKLIACFRLILVRAMKYSVLTIFLVTGYVALLLAGMQEEDTWWRHGATLAWLGMIAYLVVQACDSVNPLRATLGRVALGCIVAYMAMAYLPGTPRDAMPHQWFAEWYAPQTTLSFSFTPIVPANSAVPPTAWNPPLPGTSVSSVRAVVVETLAAMNTALLFGVVAGIVAVACFRRAAQTPGVTDAPK